MESFLLVSHSVREWLPMAVCWHTHWLLSMPSRLH